jgi:hypothetical protein
MTVLEALTFLRSHGLVIRWSRSGQLSTSDLCALISILANRTRGQA